MRIPVPETRNKTVLNYCDPCERHDISTTSFSFFCVKWLSVETECRPIQRQDRRYNHEDVRRVVVDPRTDPREVTGVQDPPVTPHASRTSYSAHHRTCLLAPSDGGALWGECVQTNDENAPLNQSPRSSHPLCLHLPLSLFLYDVS